MRVHIFDSTTLAHELARAQVDAELQAKYLVVSFVMFTLAFHSGLVAPGSYVWTLPSVLEGIAIIAISIFGVAQAFEAAGGRNSRTFLVEFTCLYVPISVTTLLGVWGGYWCIRLGFYSSLEALSASHLQFAINLSRAGTDFLGFITFLAAVAVQGITYWRMVRLLRRVNLERAAS